MKIVIFQTRAGFEKNNRFYAWEVALIFEGRFSSRRKENRTCVARQFEQKQTIDTFIAARAQEN